MSQSTPEEIKALLDASYSWPAVYQFKFIIEGDLKKIALVQDLFNTNTSEISMKNSSKGKYVSITAKEVMNSSDEVLKIYAKAKAIEGLISL